MTDNELTEPFSLPLMHPSASLHPIRTWEAMYLKTQVTGVKFGALWLESANEGVACFFSWMGRVRATVLVVLDDEQILQLECRGKGDRLLSTAAAAPIALETWRVFGPAFGTQ